MKNINEYINEASIKVNKDNIKFINIEFSYEFNPITKVFSSENELYRFYEDVNDLDYIKEKVSKLGINECCVLNTWGDLYTPRTKGDKKLFSEQCNFNVIIRLK